MSLDQDVVNLAKAIRQVETGNRPVSGASGELKSRYQYMPATWKSTAKKYLGDENAELTLENENKATYLKIKEWKDAGYKPDQIASMWNSGKPDWQGKIGVNSKGVKYDVPAYVAKVGTAYKTLKGPEKTGAFQPIAYTPPPGASAEKQADIASAKQYGALFAPNTQNPSALSEGLKSVANIPTSAFGFVKGAINMINPVNIAKNIGTAIGGASKLEQEQKNLQTSYSGEADLQNKLIQKYNELKNAGQDTSQIEDFMKKQGIDPTKIATAKQAGSARSQYNKAIPGALYESFVPEATRGLIQAGGGAITGNESKIDTGLQTAQRALVSDPVGQILPFLIAGKYGAKKLGVESQFDTAISKTAQPVIKPFKAVGEKVSQTAKFGAGQATGLQPETITQILKQPESFTKASKAKIDRASLGKEVQSSLTRRTEAIKETGKLYDPIRKIAEPINVSKNWLADTLKKETGLSLEKGKFKSSASSKIRAQSDVRAIQSLYDTYKKTFKSGKMTPNEFLNFRADLAELAKFERQIGKSKPVETVTKSTRAKLNTEYRKQIKGLEELDKQYGPQISELKTLTKGIVNKEGQLTDAAINRIANATGKGKDLLLSRLEETVPGITQKIKVLKAVEDIQNASGIKVGTYSRTGLIAGAGLSLGIIQGIVTAILTSPEIAVPMLRSIGVLRNSTAVQQIIKALKQVNELPENLQKNNFSIVKQNEMLPEKINLSDTKQLNKKNMKTINNKKVDNAYLQSEFAKSLKKQLKSQTTFGKK